MKWKYIPQYGIYSITLTDKMNVTIVDDKRSDQIYTRNEPTPVEEAMVLEFDVDRSGDFLGIP